MTRSSLLLLTRLALVSAGIAASLGCDSSSSDTGARDAAADRGTGDEDCGELGETCCDQGDRCRRVGLTCESNTCCAEANGASCGSDADCCDGLECDRGRGACCGKEQTRCESDAECCDGYVCDEIEDRCRPEDPPGCGEEGEACDCYDGRCAEGLLCADDVCAPCGGIDEPCCPSGQTGSGCRSTLKCEDNVCRDCGELDEPCCEGDDCDGRLTCEVDLICRGDPDACDYDDCAECAADSGCGFCNTRRNSDCRASRGDCPLDEWIIDVNACPASGPCDARECGPCLADEGCGFCGDTGTCESVRGSCEDWITSDLACPVNPNCGQHDSCAACTAAPNCGFCRDTNDCLWGGSGGPFEGVCPSEAWAFIADRCE